MSKRTMKEEHFQELLTSVRQMGDYLKGKKVPGLRVSTRSKPLSSTDVRRVRVKILKVTQATFAQIIGEGLGAVRSWEQGTRHPGGAASKIIRLVKAQPNRAREFLSV